MLAIGLEDPVMLQRLVHLVARGFEAVGVATMVGGSLVASGAFLWRLRDGGHFGERYHLYRGNLGRAILLGLEFLVAADIIGTVAVEPTFESLGVLAAIVVIRTFLSFSLEVEINGHWPWKDAEAPRRADREKL